MRKLVHIYSQEHCTNWLTKYTVNTDQKAGETIGNDHVPSFFSLHYIAARVRGQVAYNSRRGMQNHGENPYIHTTVRIIQPVKEECNTNFKFHGLDQLYCTTVLQETERHHVIISGASKTKALSISWKNTLPLNYKVITATNVSEMIEMWGSVLLNLITDSASSSEAHVDSFHGYRLAEERHLYERTIREIPECSSVKDSHKHTFIISLHAL